jgi:uncharacterized phiE125 gp8 family phage protein
MEIHGIPQVVKVTALPVTLDEFKKHLRITEDNEDDMLQHYLSAACEQTESLLNMSLSKQTRALYFDSFPAVIYLRFGPVSEVVKVEYIAPDETEYQEFSETSYQQDLVSKRPRLVPMPDTSWPETRDLVNAVKITYSCGVAPDKLNKKIKQAILLLASTWYKNREALGDKQQYELPKSYQFLITANKRWVIV